MTVFIGKLYFTCSETRSDPAGRFQTAGSQRLAGMSRFGQNVGWCILGRSALEGRLGRVGHVELDHLSRLLAAQMGSDSQGSVDAGGDHGGKHPITIQHDTFIYRNCAKKSAGPITLIVRFTEGFAGGRSWTFFATSLSVDF